MRISLALLIFLPRLVVAGACCMGAGPKSFIQLRHLESYQLGVSTSFRDVYGKYNAYGDLVSSEKNQTYTAALGAGVRFFDDLEVSASIPWVYQIKGVGSDTRNATRLGDMLINSRYLLVRSLFRDEWYPTIYLTGGLKLPTGSVERISSDEKLIPGTGNGVWEPYLGLALQKDLHFVVIGFNATYTRRFGRMANSVAQGEPFLVKEGDKIDLTESVIFPMSQRLSFSVGSGQSWELAREMREKPVADSSTRVVSAFLSGSYFVSRFWSVSAGWEFALPLAGTGVNQQLSRSLTLTTNYAFF